MAHLAVTVALLFLVCVHAAPEPEPSNPKFTLAKDSSVGVGLAGQNSKAHGVVGTNRVVEKPFEAPVETGNNVPDFTLIDNVHAGTAVADGRSVATGVITNKQFPDPKQEPSKPVFGWK